MASPPFPELDRRLREERSAFTARAQALRDRLRRDLAQMAPRQQLRRHPQAALAVAVLTGLLAGRIAGRLLRALLR